MSRLSIGLATLAAGIVLAPMVHGQGSQSPKPAIGARLDGFETWLELARSHAPGKVDASVTQVRRIDVERHFALAMDLEALIQFINDPGLNRLRKPGRQYTVDEQRRLKHLAAEERAAGTTDNLLRKIALLESDDLMLRGGQRYVVVPLFSGLRNDMVFSLDGVAEQAVATPPNWRIGRLAIGAMTDDPDTVAWARLWYEATTAFLFADRVLAVLEKHLPQRRLDFPEDAGAWFDQGCYFVNLADARFQHALADSRRKGYSITGQDRQDTLAQARRMFEEALARDPRYPEARVRLARVKLDQNDARTAVRELSAVLPDLGTDPLLRYLAYLFLGAAQESAGDETASMTAYREAASLYPRAMSPRVSLARLEPPPGPGADLLEDLLHDERSRSDDPWLAYHTGPARRSPNLAAELWRVSSLR